MFTPQLFLLSLVMMSGTTDESGQATFEEMKAAYLQNANSLNSVQARWSIKKTPEIGAIHSHEYQVSVGKDNIKGGRGDAVFERMANSKPPEATGWWGQLVRNRTGTQLAFVNPLNAGTPKPDEPLPLPLTSEQFQDDLHNGWSIFGWADANEPVRCMIGQRHRGLLAGAVLQQLPDSPEFQFPPLLSPTKNFGGVRHPFDELFDHDLEAMGEVDLEGRRYQLVQSLAEPIPYSQMEIPESLHGRYQVFPRVRAWLDPEHWYLPVRIESDNMVQFDGAEVKVNKGSISDRVLTAELDVIDIDGQQVSYPKQLVVETRRIDPTYQGPYEDDVVGILNGTVPLPDYP
ncbi:MAG: hypothetical protein KDA80_24860, partial [Planctomycetaceae bacterium]|nr:hypothetical protein [Planctomycetaceae bacterium]